MLEPNFIVIIVMSLPQQSYGGQKEENQEMTSGWRLLLLKLLTGLFVGVMEMIDQKDVVSDQQTFHKGLDQLSGQMDGNEEVIIVIIFLY